MTQIKPHEIIQEDEGDINPNFALPRDLYQPASRKLNSGMIITPENTNMPIEGIDIDTSGEGQPDESVDYGNEITDPFLPPQVPLIKSVKRQTINMTDDGTYTVDVVLEVSDITGVSEYDVRVARDNGNL